MAQTAEITGFDGPWLKLRLTHAGDCGGCALSSLCGDCASAVIVRAKAPSGLELSVGDTVLVEPVKGSAARAAVMFIAVPCALLVAVVVGLTWARAGDTAAALCGIGAVGVWYAALWLLRARLNRRAQWMVIGKDT